jgi:hypothetical protein
MPQEMTALAHMRLLGSSGDRRPWSKGVSACASMCLQSETVASRLLLPRHILPLRYADFLSDCPNVFRMLGVCALRSCGVPAELRLVLNLQFNSPVSQSCTSDQDIPTSIGVRRVPDHNDVLEVQLDEHFSEIVGVLIHIVALPRLLDQKARSRSRRPDVRLFSDPLARPRERQFLQKAFERMRRALRIDPRAVLFIDIET